jgi:hypothetical protein
MGSLAGAPSKEMTMSEPDTLATALLDSLNGSAPWAALGRLPQVAKFDQASDRRLDLWAGADLLDCAVALTCTHYLVESLLEKDVPTEIEGADRFLLTECRYSATSTVPRLLIAQRLLDSAMKLSALLPGMRARHAADGTEPVLGAVDTVRGRLDAWVDKDVLDALLSSSLSAREQFSLLEKAAQALTVSASWYYVRVAVERWPASLEGRMAAEMFARISTFAEHIMTQPDFLILTSESTWSKLSALTGSFATTYPAAVRSQLASANAPSGKEFVAVLDPRSAVNCAALRTIGPWLKVVRSAEDASEFEFAVKNYWRVRGREELSTGSADSSATGVAQYTDFVVPVEGDGSWPSSVADVEYVVREMIVAGGIEGAFKAPQELIAPTDRGWVWIRTPWSLPLALAEDDNARDLHRRAPLIAWMIHCSSNPFADQNMFGNTDKAIAYMEKVGQSNDRGRRLKAAMLDVESIFIPSALATSSILPILFPQISAQLVAALAAMVYPIIKVARSRLN